MPSQLTGNSAICLAECSEGDNKGKHQSSIVLAFVLWINPWWRHQMETFSALLALCVGNSPITGEFPTQRPVTRSFDVFFALRNGWVNNGEAGDFKSHRAHYDVIVMRWKVHNITKITYSLQGVIECTHLVMKPEYPGMVMASDTPASCIAKASALMFIRYVGWTVFREDLNYARNLNVGWC